MICYTPELLRKNPTITSWTGTIIFLGIILMNSQFDVYKKGTESKVKTKIKEPLMCKISPREK